MTDWRHGYRPARTLLDVDQAAELYQAARRNYLELERQLEADQGNHELRQALEVARRARQQAWVIWLNLARPRVKAP